MRIDLASLPLAGIVIAMVIAIAGSCLHRLLAQLAYEQSYRRGFFIAGALFGVFGGLLDDGRIGFLHHRDRDDLQGRRTGYRKRAAAVIGKFEGKFKLEADVTAAIFRPGTALDPPQRA